MESPKRILGTVLIVSHSYTSALPLRIRLVQLGYHHFTEVGSATEALQSVYPLPNLIIFDTNVRDMDGVSFVHSLRRNTHLDNVPVVLIYRGPDDVERAAKSLACFPRVLCITRVINEQLLERL